MTALAKGIDVSKWQGNIDWKKVKTAGIEFAMLRGGYGKNSNQKDAYFEQYYKNAKAVGMPVGVYHYSYATSVEDAKKEAEFCISYLKGKQLEYPVAFDIEDKTQISLTTERRTDIVKAFCDAMEKAGYYVILYTNLDWTRTKLDMSKLTKYDVWIAQWAAQCTYTGNYGMWQYSDKGKVAGISGNVDMDYAYKDYPSIIKKAGLNGFKKETTKPAEKPANNTVEKPAEKPETKPAKKPADKTADKSNKKTKEKYVKGAKVVLIKKPIYSSAYTKAASGTKTGIFYLYDGVNVNGRYRITVKKNMCGKKPTYQYVTGWIEL